MSCCICLKELNPGARCRLSCNHDVFHRSCLAEWLVLDRSCPLCRRYAELPPLPPTLFEITARAIQAVWDKAAEQQYLASRTVCKRLYAMGCLFVEDLQTVRRLLFNNRLWHAATWRIRLAYFNRGLRGRVADIEAQKDRMAATRRKIYKLQQTTMAQRVYFINDGRIDEARAMTDILKQYETMRERLDTFHVKMSEMIAILNETHDDPDLGSQLMDLPSLDMLVDPIVWSRP